MENEKYLSSLLPLTYSLLPFPIYFLAFAFPQFYQIVNVALGKLFMFTRIALRPPSTVVCDKASLRSTCC